METYNSNFLKIFRWGCGNCFQQVHINILRKKVLLRKYSTQQFSDMSGNFCWSLRQGCRNCNWRVHLNNLIRKLLIFSSSISDIGRNCFVNFWKVFWWRCQSSTIRIHRNILMKTSFDFLFTFPDLKQKITVFCRKTFDGFVKTAVYKAMGVLYWKRFLREKKILLNLFQARKTFFRTLELFFEIFLAGWSKLHFSCPEQQFRGKFFWKTLVFSSSSDFGRFF